MSTEKHGPDRASILVYGFGNPGRSDDGLGPACAALVDAARLDGVATDSNYQLNAEDALTISEFDIIIFADASVASFEGFRLSALAPDDDVGFTTHAMSPGSVVALCRELYGKRPDTYILEMRGFVWDMAERLSDKADANLKEAWNFLQPLLVRRDRRAFADAAGQGTSQAILNGY